MRMTTYRIPDDGMFYTINFSGGETSACMTWRILDAHDGVLPDNCAVIFCNTGKERLETLDFVRDFQRATGVDVRWLEYRHVPDAAEGEWKHAAVEVDYATASRNGEPFRALVEYAAILPNPVMRKCTAELKVRTVERFCARELDAKKAKVRNIIGLRYDEPRRWKKKMAEGCDSEFPLVLDKTTKRDVKSFWAGQNFQLKLRDGEGNCDLCFLKGKRKLVGLIARRPRDADWWIETERLAAKSWDRQLKTLEMARFSKEHSYADLRMIATSTGDMFDGLEDDEDMDCYCTN